MDPQDGRRLTARTDPATLQRVFAYALLGVAGGVVMLVDAAA